MDKRKGKKQRLEGGVGDGTGGQRREGGNKRSIQEEKRDSGINWFIKLVLPSQFETGRQ